MSNSPLISFTQISPNQNSPRNHVIDTVTIHCVVGQLSVETMGAMFAKSIYQASCNYCIGSDGRIGLIVPEDSRSWCSSNRENDNRAITIECACDLNDPYAVNSKVYASLINLLVDICQRNGIDALRWQADKSLIGQPEKQNMTVHRWFAAKACPGDYLYNRHSQIASEVNARLNGETDIDAGVSEQWYRNRKSWDDADSQTGAYKVLDNAVAACLPGYAVYDWNGKEVYRNNKESEGTQTSEFASLSETESAAKLLEICRPIAEAYGLLPSVCAAQTILESGYCKTELAQKGNNVCGMKCTLSGNTWAGSTWDGKSKVNIRTAEQDSSGNTYYIYADFRKYPCIEDSISDRCAYLLGAMNGSKKRYEGIQSCKDYKSQITLIKNGGYATDVSYISKICNIIERFGLDKYDGTTSSGNNQEGSGVDTPTQAGEPYRVRKAWGTTMEGQIGAFYSLENAKKCADENPGYYVYDGEGNRIYPEITQASGSNILEQCTKFQKQLEADIKAGKNWEYHNPSKYLEEQWSNALKNNKRACNCALLARWALKEAGLIPQDTKIFYGKLGGTIQWGSGTKEAVTATCDLISVQNRTVQQLISDGTLQPGDIVTYVNLQHTNIYAGNGIWYDAGHAYCNGSGEGAIFNSWYGDGKYNNQKVGYIIRPKAVQGEQTGECKYIVQAGAYTKRSNAEARVEKLKAAGFDVFIKFEDNFYKIQAGAYEKKENAEKQVAALKAAGFTAFIR